MKLFSILVVFLFVGSIQSLARADQASAKSVRWTSQQDSSSEFLHVIQVLNQQTGFQLSESQFMMIEDQLLATSRFRMYAQVAAGLPIKSRSLRIWTDVQTNSVIQVEALVESEEQIKLLTSKMRFLNQKRVFLAGQPVAKNLNGLALRLVKNSSDSKIQGFSYQDLWQNGEPVRLIKVKARRGVHQVTVSIDRQKVIDHVYRPFERSDVILKGQASDEFALPARVYPIYEETADLVRLTPVLAQLKHLKRQTVHVQNDLYAPLRSRRYLGNQLDAILGNTQEGQRQGYWSMSDVKDKAALLLSQAALSDNSFSNSGVRLEGRYATVSLHPDAVKTYTNLSFVPQRSPYFRPSWKMAEEGNDYEMVPSSGFFGRALGAFEESFQRPARRLADHSPVDYINDGFDEVQVYYAIDTLMTTLHEMGFTDPELSTRAFHAFLFDPDIESRDNAYYTDDTINFTTYSPKNQNYARDNSTIWHELGHGIMDRLMGNHIVLADTGGLSEGMADFVADLVIAQVTGGRAFPGSDQFRIMNKIGFSLTNEVHDDGESYGGAMHDILIAARERDGNAGVIKVGDLTMEAMRLSRNHPGLTAEMWFERMLFADERGHEPLRAKGEFRELILNALNNRNFSLTGQAQAKFQVMNADTDVANGAAGTRENPIRIALANEAEQAFALKVITTEGEAYKFSYPLTVKVQLRGGPLQGAIKWIGEEATAVEYQINGPSDAVNLNLTVKGECDYVNSSNNECKDFAYILLIPNGSNSPIAKKRFYLQIGK